MQNCAICIYFFDFAEISSTIKSLLLLHPNSSVFWVQLGDVYFSSLSLNLSKNGERLKDCGIHAEISPIDIGGTPLSIKECGSLYSEHNSLPADNHISEDIGDLRISVQDCCDMTCSESKFFPKSNNLTTLSNNVSTQRICKDHCRLDCRRIFSEESSILACLTCYMASR